VAYRILFTPRALRDLRAVPDRDRARIGVRIDALALQPRPDGARKLAAADDIYRLRVGDYRILYVVADRVVTVTVVRIGHRRDIYR
jgi:mRNA interferase RelE/StbE